MLRKVCLGAAVVSLTVLLVVGGCPPSGGTGGGQTNTTSSGNGTSQAGGEEGIAPGEIKTIADISCGERTIETAPASMYLEMQLPTSELSVSPEDSTLARAVFGPNPNQAFSSPALSVARILYEVDKDGKAVATYTLTEQLGKKIFTKVPVSMTGSSTQFAVKDGCLTTTTTAQSDLNGIVPQIEPGPCGTGAVPLTRNGMGWISSTTTQPSTQPAAEHICIEVKILEICMDCWGDKDGWHQKSSAKYRLTALGSLDNVRVPQTTTVGTSGAAAPQTVNIQEGDSFELSFASESAYKASASPTELGYQDVSTAFGGGTGFDPNMLATGTSGLNQ